MSQPATAPKAVPNPVILQNLQTIANMNELRKFNIVPSHTKEIQWNKLYLMASFALGLVAAIAYKKAPKAVSIGAGLGSVAILTQARKVVDVASGAYAKQCETVNTLFKGVAEEIRTTWRIAADQIATSINKEKFNSITVEEANNKTAELANTYLKGEWFWQTSKFMKEEKDWRTTFQTMHPILTHIQSIKLDELQKNPDTKLDPVVFSELSKVQSEANRLLYGQSPAVPNTVYVENRLVGKKGSEKIHSQPWPAKKL